ncbi:MAG TPA: DUF2938 domain-containing protein [Burkholderiales bacterium]
MDYFVNAALVGTGATAVMDLWGILRQRVFGIPNMNYGLVGRWLAWMPRGRFRHERIAATPAVQGEKAIGWSAHYATGIAFAAAFLGLAGLEWAQGPALAPALAFGIATVAAPFLLMQPGMGAGIAARRTPRPGAARLQSLVTHAVFGFGLYAAATLVNFLKG